MDWWRMEWPFFQSPIHRGGPRGVSTKGVSMKRPKFPYFSAFYTVVSKGNFQKPPWSWIPPFLETLLVLPESEKHVSEAREIPETPHQERYLQTFQGQKLTVQSPQNAVPHPSMSIPSLKTRGTLDILNPFSPPVSYGRGRTSLTQAYLFGMWSLVALMGGDTSCGLTLDSKP